MKISPKTKEAKQVDFAILRPGEAFLMRGGLYIKTNGDNQEAVNLNNGEIFYDNCGEYVEPVDSVVTWERKKAKN